MNNYTTLGKIAAYSSKRIPVNTVTIDNYVTVDNLLPNKQGVATASGMPSVTGYVPGYDTGNILVGNIRPYLKKIWFANRSGGASADVLVLSVKDGYSSRYVYYSMFLDDFFSHMMRGKKGTKMPRGDKRQVLEYAVAIHELPTQQKIAAVLSSLDEKIELNNRINAELEAMAKTLYDYWFVQKAKTSKWKTDKLGNFIRINERSITKDYPFSEIEYIDISSVSGGHLTGTTKYSLKDSPSRASRLVKHGDTIWSTVRPNRKSYLFICNPKDNLVISTGFVVLTPEKITPSFLYFFTTSEQFIKYLVSNAEGSAYPAVSADRFAEINFSVPPESELVKFENVVGPMLAKIAQNKLESQTLAHLRDWLLPMLMNGQVTVK